MMVEDISHTSFSIEDLRAPSLVKDDRIDVQCTDGA